MFENIKKCHTYYNSFTLWFTLVLLYVTEISNKQGINVSHYLVSNKNNKGTKKDKNANMHTFMCTIICFIVVVISVYQNINEKLIHAFINIFLLVLFLKSNI